MKISQFSILILSVALPVVHAQFGLGLIDAIGKFIANIPLIGPIIAVVLRAVGIQTGTSGPICTFVIDDLIGTIAGGLGLSDEDIAAFNCECEITFLTSWTLKTYCDPITTCFTVDGTEYCGTTTPDLTFNALTLTIPPAFGTVSTDACWAYDGANGIAYDDVCITAEIGGDLETVNSCSIQTRIAGTDTVRSSCGCTPCTPSSGGTNTGVIISCGTVDLDPTTTEFFLPTTECVSAGDFASYEDGSWHPFMTPL